MNEDMKTLFKIFLTAIAAVVALDGSAQNIAAKKSRLATGANGVTVVEQSEVSDAVRSVESRAKRTKVNGYTILILSDNSSRARENAVEAKDTFEENFPETEVKMYYETPSFYVTAGSYLTKEEAIIEMMRFRSVFPKAIAQNREMDITDFIIGNEEEQDE